LPACLCGPLLGILLGPLVGAIIESFSSAGIGASPRAKLSLQAGVGIVVGSLGN